MLSSVIVYWLLFLALSFLPRLMKWAAKGASSSEKSKVVRASLPKNLAVSNKAQKNLFKKRAKEAPMPQTLRAQTSLFSGFEGISEVTPPSTKQVSRSALQNAFIWKEILSEPKALTPGAHTKDKS